MRESGEEGDGEGIGERGEMRGRVMRFSPLFCQTMGSCDGHREAAKTKNINIRASKLPQ